MVAKLNLTSPEEYMARERVAEYKSEYVNRHILAMTGSSLEHNLIAENMHTALNTALHDRLCLVFNSDMKIQVPNPLSFYYPDVTVVYDKPYFADSVRGILLNPFLLCEIYGTEDAYYKRETKFMAYREIESCREYLLIEQQCPHVTRYVRQSMNRWLRADIFGMDNEVKLESLAVTLPLSEIYRMVKFPVETAATESDPQFA